MQIQIRKRNLEMTPELVVHVRRRLHFSLGRFHGRLRSIGVQLECVSGPQGGSDPEFKVILHTSWRRRIVIEERDADIFAAITRAAQRVSQAVERQAALRYGSRGSWPAPAHWGG